MYLQSAFFYQIFSIPTNISEICSPKKIELKNSILTIFLILFGLHLSGQIYHTPEQEYVACDQNGDGYVSIPFDELQNYALDFLDLFDQSPEVYVTRAHDGISKITNLYNNPQVVNLCGDIDGNGGYYDIAINNQQEVYVVRQHGWLQKLNTENCTLQTITQIHSNGQSVLALSFDHLNNLYEGGWTSKVYRAPANDLQNFQLWHDFGEGRASGDFVQIGNFMYVAWTMPNNRDYLFKVTLGPNNEYISHEDLGRIDGGTYGLAAEYGKLYGNTTDYLYEINLETMQTTVVQQRPDVFNYSGEWWGAAGLHEALNLEISYHRELLEAENGTNPLSDPYTNEIPFLDWVYIRVHEATQNTTYVIPVKIRIAIAPQAQNAELIECKDETNGMANFQLNLAESQINPSAEVEFAYFDSLENLENHQNLLPTNISVQASQIIYVKVYMPGAENCYNYAELKLNVPSADEVIYEENIVFCLGTTAVLSVPDEFLSYEWIGISEEDLNQPLNTNEVIISQPGNYFLKVTDENNCTFSLPFEAILGGSPEITNVSISGNSIHVQVMPSGIYEYSLDGVFWQSSPSFYNLLADDYLIYVRDLVGCMAEPYEFTYFEVPNFISPNGDGKNDVWQIKGIEKYPEAKIQIFDRYGKVFADRKANAQGVIWDGKYLGNPVPSGTYWYILSLSEEQKLTGYITVRN